MKKQIVVEIMTVTPSNNKLIRMHFRDYKKFKVRLAWELVAAYNHRIPTVSGPDDFRTIKFTSYRVSLLDEDNLNGGLKPLIDCIKDAELIWDDAPMYFDYEVEQVKVKKRNEERTEIIFYL